MQKKYLVINGIISFCTLFSLGCASSGITVRKTMEKGMVQYRTASVVVQCEDLTTKGRWYGVPGSRYLEDEIVAGLKTSGIARSFDERHSDLSIECRYQNGWSLPHTGRHFDLFFTSIYLVNIKIVDKGSSQVVGDVEYRRPRITTRPPRGFVDTMFSELMKGRGGRQPVEPLSSRRAGSGQ